MENIKKRLGNLLAVKSLVTITLTVVFAVLALRETISGNVNFACDYITQHFEGVSVSKPEGTYMLFLDCTDWCKAHGKTIAEVEKAGWNVGVAWQDGRMFHGPCAIRMNLALPLTRVQEAFERLDKYVFNGEWV